MMQRIAIPYRKAPGMLTPMPLLDFDLSYHENSIHVTALVDSGAMISILPFELGEQLGFSWDEQCVDIQLGGILQGAKASAVILQAHIDRLPPVRLVFAWTARTDRPVPLVLGQINFFKQFRVDFTGNDELVYVSLTPEVVQKN